MSLRIQIAKIRSSAITRARLRFGLTAILLALLCLFPVKGQKMNAQSAVKTRTDEQCIANLKNVYRLIKLHLHHSAGALGFPNLEKLQLMTHNKRTFICPADEHTKSLKKGTFRTSYQIVNDPLKPQLAGTPPNRIGIVAEERANHAGNRFVLFYDGSVRAFDESQFNKLKDNSFIDN